MLLALTVSAPVWSDTIKLKDGTVLDGSILSETESQVVFRVEYASGTITRRETVNKADVVEIKRLTEEEKVQLQMQRDFEATQKYRLAPSNSLPLAQCDQIINNVLLRFLTQYPNSPHKKEILDAVAQWQADRDLVALGKVKYRGRWLTPEETVKFATDAQRAADINGALGMNAQLYEKAKAQLNSLASEKRRQIEDSRKSSEAALNQELAKWRRFAQGSERPKSAAELASRSPQERELDQQLGLMPGESPTDRARLTVQGLNAAIAQERPLEKALKDRLEKDVAAGREHIDNIFKNLNQSLSKGVLLTSQEMEKQYQDAIDKERAYWTRPFTLQQNSIKTPSMKKDSIGGVP